MLCLNAQDVDQLHTEEDVSSALHTTRHVPSAISLGTLQNCVAVGKPINKQDTYSTSPVKGLSMFSHVSSVNDNTCNYTRYKKQLQNLCQQPQHTDIIHWYLVSGSAHCFESGHVHCRTRGANIMTTYYCQALSPEKLIRQT